MNEVTVYANAVEELRALNLEIIDYGHRSLAAGLRMGEVLSEERKNFPARSGWGSFLNEVGIPHSSDWKLRKLWAKRSIIPSDGNITLNDAYRLTGTVSRRKTKDKAPSNRKLKDQSTRNVSKETSFSEYVLGLFEGIMDAVALQYPDKTRDNVIEVICS